MAKRPHDDLFESSTMTFGEHLEELRGSLVYALGGTMVGVLIGLSLANFVVKVVETPLRNALERYILEASIEELRVEGGGNLTDEVENSIRDDRWAYEDVLISERDSLVSDEEQSEVHELEQATDTDGAATSFSLSDFPGFEQVRIWRPIKTRITALSVHESFMIWLKAGVISGIILASPWIFYHIWAFVAAGLYPHERQYVYIFLPFSLLLFLLGVGMAFFFVFEPVLDFLFSFNKAMEIDPDPRISEWISFVLFLPIGFGLAFQLPLVMLFVNRIGIFSVAAYVEKWRIAVLAIFVLSMFLTPADPVSMLLMACPLCILYFLGVMLCKWMPSIKNPYAAEGYDP